MKIAIAFVLLAAVLVTGCTQQTTTTAQTTTPTTISGQPATVETTAQTTSPAGQTTAQTTIPSGGQETTVEMNSNGFNPQTVTINKGDKVTWVNLDTNPHWPASAFHPTHTAYPGSGIQKCGTSEQSNIFDACKGLGPEETYSFTFNEVGEWNYHDHLNPSLFGKVIVQE